MFQGLLLLTCLSVLLPSVRTDSCRYEGTKGVIDLTILGRVDGLPAFFDVSPGVESNYRYSYNPCKTFTEGRNCSDVAACQISNDLEYRYTIGTQSSAVWDEGSGTESNPSIVYSSDMRKTRVILQCGEEQPKFEALGEGPINIYTFRLTHKCACWNGCSGSIASGGSTTTAPTTPVVPNSCRFHSPLGVIDLTTLGRTDNLPAFLDVSPGPWSNFKYSYNPCRSFAEGDDCYRVAVCQVSNDFKFRYAVGVQESAVWNDGSGTGIAPSVTYTSGEKSTQVILICGNDAPVLEALGESPINFYTLRLTHKCACWNGCSGQSTIIPSPTPTSTMIPTPPSCRFQSTKGVIDLTTLGRTDGVPAFSDVSPGVASNYKYSYNPCKPFTEGSECLNVAACQVSNDLQYHFAIGSQESAQWNEGAGLGNSPSITYTSGVKTTVVTLACGDDTVQLEALGENPTNTYKFRLTHKCACWNGCSGSSNGSNP